MLSKIEAIVHTSLIFTTQPVCCQGYHQGTADAGKLWSLGRLNHVAIAVPDLEAATSLYRDVLGATVSDVVVRTLLQGHHDNVSFSHCQNMECTLFLWS